MGLSGKRGLRKENEERERWRKKKEKDNKRAYN